MPNLHRAVVLACGGDPTGDEAVRFAVREATLRRAPLIVLATYLRPVDPDIESFDTPDSELARGAKENAEHALTRALQGRRPLPEHRTVTACGLPAHVLLRDFAGAALIVVGSRHRHLWGRIVHGDSVSSKLIAHSPIPVVVVAASAP